MTPSFADLLRTLYTTERCTIAEVAVQLNMSPETVRRALIEADIPRRPRGAPAGKYLPAGGLSVDADGCLLQLSPDHPYAVGGYVRQHRLVMEDVVGRYLEPAEVVSHINGRKADNRPENLRLHASNSDHKAETLVGNARARGDVGNPKRRVRRARSPEQMLHELASLHASLGRPIRRSDLVPPHPSHRAVRRAFGSWQLGVAVALERYGPNAPDHVAYPKPGVRRVAGGAARSGDLPMDQSRREPMDFSQDPVTMPPARAERRF